MKATKELAIIGVYIAILIGGQFLLSGISGVEIVTVLFLSFCFTFGIIDGLVVATVFSVLRCAIFGFYPSVIIDYLIYYNLFAVYFGFLGRIFKNNVSITRFIIIVASSAVFTAIFTLIDNIVTPLIYQIDFKAYFISSLYAFIPQIICAVISVCVLFFPLYKILFSVKSRLYK